MSIKNTINDWEDFKKLFSELFEGRQEYTIKSGETLKNRRQRQVRKPIVVQTKHFEEIWREKNPAMSDVENSSA